MAQTGVYNKILDSPDYIDRQTGSSILIILVLRIQKIFIAFTKMLPLDLRPQTILFLINVKNASNPLQILNSNNFKYDR